MKMFDLMLAIMVMVMNLYSAFLACKAQYIQMRFTSKGSMGEIGHQHI